MATPHSDFSQLLGPLEPNSPDGAVPCQQMVRESQLLRRILESDVFVVMITDINGRIEYVNQRFTKLTGYTLNEVLGSKPSTLKSGEQPDDYYAALWQTITVSKTWKGEFHNRRKDGTLFWES